MEAIESKRRGGDSNRNPIQVSENQLVCRHKSNYSKVFTHQSDFCHVWF